MRRVGRLLHLHEVRKRIPPPYALAEHCDPVLAIAKSQAHWDHDACCLCSLPDIPDWATSPF